jgi:hypothetical protein
MSKKSRMQRRQFLAASGMVLAQAAMLAGVSQAQPAPPTTGLPLTPSFPPLTGALPRPNPGPKIGVSPMYNTIGGGQNPYNPHFLPQGGPSNRRLPTPPAVFGEGVREGTP